MKRYLHLTVAIITMLMSGCAKFNELYTSLSVGSNIYPIGGNGGYITVSVKCNTEFRWEIADEDSWIVYVDSSSSSNKGEKNLRFSIKANSEYEKRVGRIRFVTTNGCKEQTVTVEQEQGDAILLSDSSFIVDHNEHNLKLDIESNVDIDITCDSDWIEWAESRTMEQRHFMLNIESNSKAKERVAILLVKGGNIRQSIRIEQAGAPNLITLTLQHNDTLFYSPIWQGMEPSGMVSWGDGSTEEWHEGISHNYTTSDDVTTTFEMQNTTSFTINEIGSIDSITIEIN